MRLRNKLIFVLIIALIIPATLVILSKTENKFWDSLISAEPAKQQSQSRVVPFRRGEKFVYKIKLGNFTVGSAELVFKGKSTLGSADVYVITFEVKLAKVYDKETIYVDPETFNPLRVERKIKMFGKPSEVVEEYNQDDKFVRITTIKGEKTTHKTILSDSALQNIISLIYLYRKDKLNVGSVSSCNFPTKKLDMLVSKMEFIEVPKGNYKAYLLESVPKKYKIWIDTAGVKAPLRIDGAVSFTKLKMVLDEAH